MKEMRNKTNMVSNNHTHTKQSKVSRCHKGHAYLAKPGHLCTKLVLCADDAQSPGAGQVTHRSTNCVSHCRCGHPKSHQHSQCTLLPSTRTRYPFYRWVGWWAGVLVMFFSSCSGIRTSVLWVINPRLYHAVKPPGHTHTHPHTHTHKKKSKAKCLAATRVTHTWRSQDTCAPSRYCVPVLRNLLEPGKELAGAPTAPLTAGVGTRSPTDAFSDQ